VKSRVLTAGKNKPKAYENISGGKQDELASGYR